MESKTQLAQLHEANAIMDIFKSCTKSMLAAGIQQWDGSYPTLSQIKNDIQAKQVYILKENHQIRATITLNEQQDEQYQSVEWLIPAKRVLVIHRLAVHPNAQGKGFGKKLCLFAESYAQNNQYDVIRLDAYSGNPISLALYNKLDYQRANGLCHFHHNPIAFFCYEKAMK